METILRKDGTLWFVISSYRIAPEWTGEYHCTISMHGEGSMPDTWVETEAIYDGKADTWIEI